MINNLQHFHFLHPLWLLSLLPMAGLLWLIFNHNVADNAWHKIIDQNLLPFLLNQGSASQQGKFALWLLAAAWLIGTLALANPVWEKKPQPVFQTNTARVIVFDLSRSMEIADLAPSRLTRARFKIEDILRKSKEGQIGLVVFAGDAFTAVPLTRDADTIRALLPSLIPKIMPIQGSRADLGLLKAAELLQQAGVNKGDILLISDGVEGDLAQQAAQQIAAQGHTISVMAVGTEKGGAIPNVTDSQHNTIIVKLEAKRLQAVAEQGGGAYSLIQDNDSDLDQLLIVTHKGKKEQQGANNINSEAWHEQGPLLALLLLPFAALAFRRGWLLTLPLVFIISIQPRPVLALGWDDLWLRADQQADKAFRSGEFETASKVAQDPMLRGNAAYQQGDYQQAVDDFSTKTDTNTLYNKGNALAKLGHYKDAIAAYDNALQQQPNFADATANKKHVAALLKKQEEEKKQQQNKKDDTKDDKKSDPSSEKKQDQQDKENKASDKQSDNKKDQQNESKQDQQDQQDQQGKQEGQEQKKQDSEKKADKDSDNKAKENAFDKAAKEKKEEEKKEKSAQEEQKTQQTQQAKTKNEPQQSNSKPSETTIEKEQEAEQLSREEKIAADQWLRRIEDNPGDLLQRKFKYQYQQRQAPEGTRGSNPW
jgi:Ca-activated chloride channel family protein